MAQGVARPTVRDVAAIAGVSPTTVSHALNGKGRVDERTRRRVEDAANRIGYRANPVARNLRSGRTGMLSLVLPTIGHDAHANEALALDYYMRLASAAAAAAFTHEHALVLPPPLQSIADLRDLPIDGGILADPEMNDPRLSMFHALGLPVVTIERDLGADDDAWCVTSDNDANTRMVLDHLADRGARRIALLAPDARLAWVEDTSRTFASWTQAQGRPALIVAVPHEQLEGSAYASTLRVLDRPDRPDAIFAVSEGYASGALRAARERGLRVPDDLMLVAGVDSQRASASDPPITALDLHPAEHAAAAVELLVARLAGDESVRLRSVRGTLRVRASTDRA
jgi:DNA-binding LacI/PurR family transcriptional regulator